MRTRFIGSLAAELKSKDVGRDSGDGSEGIKGVESGSLSPSDEKMAMLRWRRWSVNRNEFPSEEKVARS